MGAYPELFHRESAPQLLRAKTTNTPASAADSLFVSIDSFGSMPPFGPCAWTPHGTHLPPAGTVCLVAMDETNIPWVIAWIGSWT